MKSGSHSGADCIDHYNVAEAISCFMSYTTQGIGNKLLLRSVYCCHKQFYIPTSFSEKDDSVFNTCYMNEEYSLYRAVMNCRSIYPTVGL